MQPTSLLEIAPGLFVRSWDDVDYASFRKYYDNNGNICRFFEIRLTNKRNHVVNDFGDDIDRTIEFWKSHSVPFGNVGELHQDIERWRNAFPQGPKRIPRR